MYYNSDVAAKIEGWPDVSTGSVAIPLKRVGMFNYDFIANIPTAPSNR